jgi:proline dehydrogenase
LVVTITRRFLYALATSSGFERAVRAVQPIERIAYRRAQRYVAGTGLDDAVAVTTRLESEGLAVSLDLFGESETDPDAIRTVVRAYEQAAVIFKQTHADVYFEIVPSHLGVDVSGDFYRSHVEAIVEILPANSRLQISAEESWRTPTIVETSLALARAGAPIMQTLQANLLRSNQDADRLVEAGVPVRLVKGAYVESPDISRQWGDETDMAYIQLAHRLSNGGSHLTLGTHDPVIRESLLLALPSTGVEMLLGVHEADAIDLVSRGHHVRIYVPFGQDWFRYWMRRLAEARGS